MNSDNNYRIAVLGLGYVGLPVALALAEKFSGVVGFDIDRGRINNLMLGIDSTKEVERDKLIQTSLHFTDDLQSLRDRNFLLCVFPPL